MPKYLLNVTTQKHRTLKASKSMNFKARKSLNLTEKSMKCTLQKIYELFRPKNLYLTCRHLRTGVCEA